MVDEFTPESALPETPAASSAEASEPAAGTPKRRRSKAAPKSAKEAVSAQPDPAAVVIEHDPSPAPAPAVPDAVDESDAAEPERAPAAPQLVATSPTTLLFQAPPMPAGGGTPDALPDLPEDDDAQGGQPASRHRSRSRADRQPSAPDKAASQQRPARKAPEPITEPQKLKGSTRLEAKKQRRRDGRDASRRRTVVTEAEFLARRESVDRTMVVRAKDGRIEIAVLEDGVLAEHYVAKAQNMSLIGNVYLGRVQNVLPSMEAAFVDIGRGRNAVLYSGEVDWEAAAEQTAEQTGAPKNQARRIENALKAGDTVLVQVTKDPVGHKGARLTSQVSLPGRYLVYVPNGSMNGISRKLPDTERARLKRILKEVLPEQAGVIVRTAAEGATEEQLTRDVQRLTSQWAAISERSANLAAPALLHSEPDLVTKIVRDIFNEDFTKLVIAGAEAKRTIEEYLEQIAPDLLERVEAYSGDKDVFAEYRIQEQIDKALERKVWLPSGGSLIIDRTEAMTVVDVNTGKFIGSGGNLEETVTKNNLEAAEEIVRQLRLRDIGGIIVVDFIDMVLESNRDLVLRRLVECL
ncbi:MAG: Rne/Rng family ribonuclease, partial [Microbacterium sp.]|nr:Rne/Rng family ribonuclease [Microbacterium sp.]